VHGVARQHGIGGPRRRLHEADLVIVMQRADGHVGQLGHAPHRQALFHPADYAA
jgi:hypothetical protein